jgi:hypothetical protein
LLGGDLPQRLSAGGTIRVSNGLLKHTGRFPSTCG